MSVVKISNLDNAHVKLGVETLVKIIYFDDVSIATYYHRSMNISSLFQKKQLKPAWTYSASGVMWRVLFSDTNFIIGEDRDTENKQVTFFCLNAANGDVLWKNISFEESWWIGIEGIAHDKVFLHGFKKPDMPEHGKIIAVDLGTGKELWRNNDYTFLYATAENVFAFRDLFEKRLYYELNGGTGEFMREFGEVPADLYEKKNANNGRTDFMFPEILNEAVAEFPLVSSKIAQHCEMGNIRGPIEFVQTSGRLVFNYHTVFRRDEATHSEVLQNRLCILDEANDKQVYAEVINADTPSPVPDSFFIDDTMVYFIKEKNTFVALPLDGEMH